MSIKSPIPTNWNKRSVEKIADIVIEHFNLSIGDPLEPMVNEQGGSIRYGSVEKDEIEGGSIIARSINDFEIVISEHTSARRDRFTIAHELGHLFLHLPMVQDLEPNASMRATRYLVEGDPEQQRAEWEANWFAAQLIMPRKEFKKCIKNFGVSSAASIFGVSELAAKVRAESV